MLSDFSIDFQDVSFSYNEDRAILKDVSLSVKEGELFALVGPSGCGKTTILRLLSRLYDANSGKILIGGKDLQNTATDSIFQKISIVFQEVNLFNTTILENIRLGRGDATEEEVREAARLANCLDFIELKSFPRASKQESEKTAQSSPEEKDSVFLSQEPF